MQTTKQSPFSESSENQKAFQQLVFLTEASKQALPVCFPFIIRHSQWGKDSYCSHSHQSMTTIEIVLEGVMSYEIEGATQHIHPNQMLLLPVGRSNTVRSGSQIGSRKIVFGIYGPLSEILLSQLGLHSGTIYDLPQLEPVIRKLGELSSLYRDQAAPESLAEIAGRTMEILLLLKQRTDANPVTNLQQMMLANLKRRIPLDEFARKNGISRTLLNRRFKEACGKSPLHYLIWQRMQFARQLLATSDLAINEIAEQTGYASIARFDYAFKAETGCSPREYRDRTASSGVSVRWSDRDRSVEPPDESAF